MQGGVSTDITTPRKFDLDSTAHSVFFVVGVKWTELGTAQHTPYRDRVRYQDSMCLVQ